MLLYKWAAMYQYLPSHSPSCFYFYWTVRALSFEAVNTIGGNHFVFFSLKTHMQNATRGVFSFGTRVSASVKAVYWASPLVVIFCCWQVNFVNFNKRALDQMFIGMTCIFLKSFISLSVKIHWGQAGVSPVIPSHFGWNLNGKFAYCLECQELCLWGT